jgi:hypothetical protein
MVVEANHDRGDYRQTSFAMSTPTLVSDAPGIAPPGHHILELLCASPTAREAFSARLGGGGGNSGTTPLQAALLLRRDDLVETLLAAHGGADALSVRYEAGDYYYSRLCTPLEYTERRYLYSAAAILRRHGATR